MRDRFPGFLFYLPDTFDTIRSGIPSALKVIAESPERNAGIRFDSENGIRGHYIYTVVRARELGLEPTLALESGWNYKLTEEFEELRKQIGWKEDKQCYGFGGYLIKPSWETFNRDDVSAVWKISQTGSRATMKFGDEPNSAKESIPGKPIIYRTKPVVSSDIVGYVFQEGEKVNIDNVYCLSDREDSSALYPGHAGRIVMSPETQNLIDKCRADKAKILQEC
jgi:nicotinic acid phosphoribosyltransferase